jgi:hypothetical protein
MAGIQGGFMEMGDLMVEADEGQDWHLREAIWPAIRSGW